ncbi:unnamed protein product [Leptosia nina]|uniref:MADF domain-containing protein n=1 Tax=Leptosia nina TaxID=320188 RepID=A0AAV1K2A3_9NEOP
MNGKQQCIDVIKAFESHNILWDRRECHSTRKKDEAWKDISERVNMPVKEVKRTIYNLRGVLRKEKSRIRNSLTSGGQPYKSKWFAFEHMQFLLDIQDLDKYKSKKRKRNNTETEDNSDNESSSTEGIPVEEAWVEEVAHSNPPTLIKEENLGASSKQYNNEESNEIFGKLVASELGKYDSETLTYVKKAIMDIIFQADLGNIERIRGETFQ